MLRSVGWIFAGAALAAVGAPQAFAQSISNETWLGQVGGTNTIVIDQSGRNNQAGADNAALRLNQDGDDNSLSITQFGHRNQVGAVFFLNRPTGVNQIGDNNEITITQQTARDAFDGSNVVGSILQNSAYLLGEPANLLTIFQSDIGGSGQAGHRIGSVRQVYAGAGETPNQATITQLGGGLDEGNDLDNLYQSGGGNVFTLTQENQLNKVGDARQIGQGNVATVEQGLFSGIVGGNLVEYLQQFGYRNLTEVVMLGSNNVVQHILQINALLGPSAIGNIANITLDSEDNGSTGNGGVGDFLSAAALAVSAAQSNVVQIGDYNRVAITITGADNKFGTRQFGEDNDVFISIGELAGQTAQRNESAVFQNGTDNYFSHTVLGSDNVGAVRQFGERNRLSVEQLGQGNLAQANMLGNGNNYEPGFTGLAASLLAPADFKPGRLYQSGLNNSVEVNVTGDDNRFGFHQEGDWNVAESTVIGTGNQVVVIQIGSGNAAITYQSGSGNTAVIVQ